MINSKIRKKIAIILTCWLFIGILIPITSGARIDNFKGFDIGPSYTSVVPLEKVTFVEYDDETYLDDYSYLAALPTAVFREQDSNRLFSHPLMFYQEELDMGDDKYRTLDAYQGIDFFMDDWMAYSNDQLDQMTLINLDKKEIDPDWDSDDFIELSGDDAYEISKEIALNDWSYSDNAVVAVIKEDFEESEVEIENKMKKTFPAEDINYLEPFHVDQTNHLNPVPNYFEVSDKYSFIKAHCWWDGILVAGKMIPAGDPDIQLYCKKDGRWMQTSQAAQWNIYRPAGEEYTQSYVYSPGDWRVTLTDYPTESEPEGPPRSGIPGVFQIQGSLLGFLKPKVTYHIDITMYPGVTFDIPDIPPFGCKDAEFKLSWEDESICLGFTLIGPNGEAIHTELNESKTDDQEAVIDSLGECLEGENYKLSVFSMNDVSQDVDFTFEYTFSQEITPEKADSLTSATEGACLASAMNAPLIYIKPGAIPKSTKDALYTLGVKNIYLVDIGGNLKSGVKEQVGDIADIEEHYTELIDIYEDVREISGSNDVIFTTIDPFTEWYVGELEPGDETEAGLYIGPAAYIAAHHGAPAVILDNHPRLSSAATWHTEFWNRYAAERYDHKPSVAEMSLTGERIYDFLGDYGFDQIGDETIITIAGQYEIGVPWDRIFPGVANSGRFIGTPVDTTVAISRSTFYPALIFENPGMSSEGVDLINGSISSRQGLIGLIKPPFLNTLVIDRAPMEEEYTYPVLCSFVTHKYRFNERASKYYGEKYEGADGDVPGEKTTMEPIDQGVIEKYTGDDGMYYPDMTETEVIPFYLNKGGFDTAFSTQLEAVVNNLNQGVLLWVHASHGTQPNGGQTLFWDPVAGFAKHKLFGIFAGAKHEENPWRGYDWHLGSTYEPDTMSCDYIGAIPFTNHNSLILPATGMDWVQARKPVREMLNRLIPVIDPFKVDNLYDGVTGTIAFSKYPLVNKNATQIEENLGNLHSAGFITGICQTSNTYFHLMMIRHGSVFQVQDPWPTSWYGAVWRQSIPRDIVLGYTVGEAYSRGIAHVGSLYLGDEDEGPQWWWDDAENVVYFGDPDLRMYVPETEYAKDVANNWERDEVNAISRSDVEKQDINGHAPFGAVSHPNAEQEMNWFEKNMFVLVILAIILLLLLVLALMGRKK